MDLKSQLDEIMKSNSLSKNSTNISDTSVEVKYLQGLLDKNKTVSQQKQNNLTSLRPSISNGISSTFDPYKSQNEIKQGNTLTNGEIYALQRANRKNNPSANDYRSITESILKNQAGRSADSIVNSSLENGWYNALKISLNDNVGHSNSKSINQTWKKQLKDAVAKNEFFVSVANKNGGKLPDDIQNNIESLKKKTPEELNFIFNQMYPSEKSGSLLDKATLADYERRRQNQEYNLSDSDKAGLATMSAVPAGMISGGKGLVNSAEAVYNKLSTGTPVLPQPIKKMTSEQKAEYDKKRLMAESEALKNGTLGDLENKNTIYQQMILSNSGLSESEILKRRAENAKRYPALAEYENVTAPNVQNNTAGRIASSLAFSTANMLPSVAANMVLPGSGIAAIGLSSGGNAYDQALLEGKTQSQALGYGILSGSAEALTQKLLGGIRTFGSNTASKALSKISQNINNKVFGAIKKISNSTVGSYILDNLSEANEEWVQANLEPIFRNVMFDENNEIKPFSQDKLEAALLGFLSASVLNLPNLADGNSSSGNKINTADNIALQMINQQNNIETAGESQSGNAAQNQSKAQYSIQTDSNGKKYVNVDTDQHIFEGANPHQYSKIANQYILDHFRGKVIGDTNKSYVNKRSAEEFAHPANRRLEQDIRNSKMKSSTELDNMMSASTFIEHTNDDGRHPDATGGWDWYSVDFVVDGNPFNGVISVKNTDNGKVFYDMTKIKSIDDRKGDLSGQARHVASANNTLSNPTIPQDTSGVNTSIRQNQANITENSARREIRVPESELKTMKAIAKARKIKFEIKDLGVDAKGSPIEGEYKNGTIYVSPYAKKPALVIFKHELTHYIENDAYRYKQLVETVKKFYSENGESLGTDFAAEIRRVDDNYRSRGKVLQDGEATREVVANFVGKYLFTDEKAIQYLAKEKPSLVRSIVNWIREQIASIKGNTEAELLIRAERMYVNALKSADKRAGIQGKAMYSTQYSLSYTTDNKPVVIVEDDILDGVPRSEWIKTVKQTIGDKFSDGIPVSGRLVKVNSITRSEYTNSKNSKYLRSTDGTIYQDKFKSANNLDEIVLASTNYINEDLKHERKDKFKEFARGDVLIRVGDNDYYAKVIVGFTTGNQMVLYDVVDFIPTHFGIKKEGGSIDLGKNRDLRNEPSSIDTTVPQKAQSVNTSISKNSENDSRKAQFSLSDDYDNAVEQYGAIPKGENPARDVQVPKQMNDDTKVRRTARTAMEAKGTPDELVDRLKVDIADGVYNYKVVSDKSAVASAKDRLNKWGFEKCYQYWKSLANEDRKVSKNDLALAEQMYIEAAYNGDFKLSQEFMVDMAVEATRAGQNAQAIRLLKNLTPEGRLYKIEKLVYRIQRDVDHKTNGKAQTIKVDENLKKRMMNAKSVEEMDAIESKVHKNIAKQLPEPTKLQKAVRKWNEWRYLSMLGNVRTHIRNILGNVLFAPAINSKNVLGALIERSLSQDKRTKAMLTPKDKAMREFAKTKFDEADALESKSRKNKYDERYNYGLDVDEKVFKIKPLEWARKTNSNLLEWEDTKAKRGRFASSFTQFVKARGWDYQNLSTEQSDAATNYAMREAKRATFQDISHVAEALNNLSHKNVATEILVEGLLPFKKTPINILKRGVEYSPVGIIKGLKELKWDVKKGNMDASQAIDNISCGLAGTAMIIVGIMLSSIGWLKSTSDDDKEGELDKLSGGQEYSLQFGDTSYTIDWIAPLSMPLFVGAEIANAIERGDAEDGAGVGRIIDSLTGMADPMFNLSMLQGINSTFKTIRHSDNPTIDIAANTVAGYLGQGVPTLLGQTARTVDTTRRNTYYTPKDSTAGKLIDKTVKKTMAKIPGVSMLLEPYVDKWGKEQTAPNWVVNAFENFASPGYLSDKTNDAVTEEMARLYKETSNTGVIPHSSKSSLSTGGNTYRLNEKEYAQYQRTLGQTSKEQLSGLIESSAYQNMSNEEKSDAVEKMYRYAEETAKAEFYNGRGVNYDDTHTIKIFNDVESSGVDLYDYLYAYVATKGMESDKNSQGKTISGSLKRKKIAYMVNNLGFSKALANKIYQLT